MQTCKQRFQSLRRQWNNPYYTVTVRKGAGFLNCLVNERVPPDIRHTKHQNLEWPPSYYMWKPYCPDSWEELVCFGHIIPPISNRPLSRKISKCRNNLQTSRQIYVIGFRSCRKYSAWQTCKSWKTTIILTVIIILPSTPLSCFSERNLIRLAAWHILTPKSSKIDCPRHNNPQMLQIFVISILQSDIKLLEVASDRSTYDRYRILRFEANGQGT